MSSPRRGLVRVSRGCRRTSNGCGPGAAAASSRRARTIPAVTADADERITAWLAALEARHLANFRTSEVTRALRALSAAYVERRGSPAAARGHSRQQVHGALDTAGKRAAFSLFYAPLHFFTVRHVIAALGSDAGSPASILDVGCGTGVAGAAWALASARPPQLLGIDHHPWVVDEARWTYRQLQLAGNARVGDLSRLPQAGGTGAIVAGWVLNELAAERRVQLEEHLLAEAARGTRVLILEPIARRVVPWWDESARKVIARGGRADEWRFTTDLPPMLKLFDKAAGLNHRELTVRTLCIGGGSGTDRS